MRNHSLIVSSSKSRMMLMALPTLGPVLLLAMCSFTCFTLPQALHMRYKVDLLICFGNAFCTPCSQCANAYSKIAVLLI